MTISPSCIQQTLAMLLPPTTRNSSSLLQCVASVSPACEAAWRRDVASRPQICTKNRKRKHETLAARSHAAELSVSMLGEEVSDRSELAESPDFQQFQAAASKGNVVPLFERIFSDHLTPVLAYRCLVKEDNRDAPSFLFESVVNGNQTGRYSFVGAQPSVEIIAKDRHVRIDDRELGTAEEFESDDPLETAVQLSSGWRIAQDPALPEVFTGGWVGYCGYDTVRYVYSGKLPFQHAPTDDRQLPDMHLALYNTVLVFDQATKLAYIITWVHTDRHDSLEAAYQHGRQQLASVARKVCNENAPSLSNGRVTLTLSNRPRPPAFSNMNKQDFLAAVAATKEHIDAGDVFQLVLSQRFERRTPADPFEVYRALRVVNPSPYMVYLQARGSILVASSPEILCRVGHDRKVINRPLAGTRRRGKTEAEDAALAQDLLADEKERAEHVMLVDLGRNDVGKVAQMGSVRVEALMEVERYSHVMHLSSTVTGDLLPQLDAWDVLRAALPAGTVSGAPKVRAMQIIDKLEVHRRGPYGGGIGHVGFNGSMDMALALRTMIIPNPPSQRARADNGSSAAAANGSGGRPATPDRKDWVIHLQAGAGIVADSVPESEYEETVNKAAALGRAIDLAEQAFVGQSQ